MSRIDGSNLERYTQNLKAYIANSLNEVTIATFNITTANTSITLKNLSGASIDWGDGTIDKLLTHKYTTKGNYVCKIYNVSSIGDEAFREITTLTSIDIGSTVKEIGSYAFATCSNLTAVTLPNTLKTIKNNAFASTPLTEIVIPEGVTSIGRRAFYNSTFTSILIPKTVTELADQIFYNNSVITIYCETESQPSGWNSAWNALNRPVVWGYFENKERVQTLIDEAVENSGSGGEYYATLNDNGVLVPTNIVATEGVQYDAFDYEVGRIEDSIADIKSDIEDVQSNLDEAIEDLESKIETSRTPNLDEDGVLYF